MSGEPGREGRANAVRRCSAGLGRRTDDDDRGATATEYALLVGFIAVVIALAVGFFGSEMSAYINHIATSLSAAL